MAQKKHASMLDELVAEFIEERVRRFPGIAFDLDLVVREISGMLTEAGEKVVLSAQDRTRISDLLERHPFLVRAAGAGTRWTPGLDKRK